MISTPKSPNPYEVARAQGAANQQAAIASSIVNNPFQATPFGSQTTDVVRYEQVMGGNTYPSQNLYVNPENGKLYWDKGFTRQIAPNQVNLDYFAPRYETKAELSEIEANKLKKTQNLETRLLETGNQQMRRIQSDLSRPLNFKGAPRLTSEVDAPRLRDNLRTDMVPTRLGNAGSVQTRLGNAGRVQDQIGGAGAIQRSYAPENGFSDDRRRVEQAIMSRLEPDFDRDRNELETQLVNQGLVRGTDAFRNAMGELREAETDARMQAVLAGGQEQSRMLGEARAAGGFANDAQAQAFAQQATRGQFANDAQQQRFGQELAGGQFANAAQQQRFGQELARGQFTQQGVEQNNLARARAMEIYNATQNRDFNNRLTAAAFQNQARQQAISEDVLKRTQPLNELNAFLSSSQVNVPQFPAPFRQGIEPAPVAESVYRSYEAERANAAAKNAGIFGLASAGLGAFPFLLSDRRVKTDIKKVGKTDGGHNIYRYRYKGDPDGLFQLGVMAQEARKKTPAAVGKINGLLGVDYRRIK